MDELWFVGDNFVSRCYRQFFKNAPETGKYVKEKFEVSVYCNSRFISNELNIIIRMKTALLTAIEKKIKLPKYVVIVLENDVVEYARYNGSGISGILGRYTEGLTAAIQKIIQAQKEQLPLKAKREGYPVIYWVNAVHHKSFANSSLRTKFNHCLEAAVNMYDSMRVIKIKEIWSYDDLALVNNNEMTPTGLSAYWKAVDALIRFNVKRNEKAFMKMPSAKKQLKFNAEGQKGASSNSQEDFIPKFFVKTSRTEERINITGIEVLSLENFHNHHRCHRCLQPLLSQSTTAINCIFYYIFT